MLKILLCPFSSNSILHFKLKPSSFFGSSFCQNSYLHLRTLNPEIQSLFRRNPERGILHCGGVKVQELKGEVEKRLFYMYRRPQITRNAEAYKQASRRLNLTIGYSTKAISLKILEHLQKLGCGAVMVSGNELKQVVHAGFDLIRYLWD